jgi:glycosidase
MKKGIRVYNLYPKLIGKMDKWINHFDRIKEMNFDWIYINPVNASGFSGSDYAIKDYYLYNPMFIKGWPLSPEDYQEENLEKDRKKGNELLKKVCSEAQKRGIKVMYDIVINHTAIDSPLVKLKPEWYERDENGKVKNAGADDNGTWVVWGDLAQIDNVNSPDKENLWKYWLDMLLHYCDLGIRGFRCDAAYHVPAELWSYLISNVKEKYSDVIFVAETLGCTPTQLMNVSKAGFDIVMNSIKWWNYKDEWFLKDYKDWAGKYLSMAFPENHDTERYYNEVNGNKDLAVNKYAIQAYFCSSIATTIGFEFGFKRKIDVVQTNPEWWETANYDISKEISEINKIKSQYQILQEDNMIIPYDFHNGELFGFAKEALDKSEKIFVVANLSGYNWHNINIPNFYEIMNGDNIKDISHGHKMDIVYNNLDYNLKPGEVKLFYIKY